MKLTSLIVDDNELSVDVLRCILTKHGVNVLTACNKTQAEHLYSMTKPDVVFVDFLLQGGVTGDDVIRSLRLIDKRALFYAVTADSSPEAHTKLDNAGAVSTLCKPYKLEEIRNAINVTKQVVRFRRNYNADSN